MKLRENSATKKLQDAIDSGNTWYKPEDKEDRNLLSREVKYNALTEDKGYFTLPLIAEQEERIAKRAILQIANKPKTFNKEKVEFLISFYETKEKINLDEWQKNAVHEALNNNLFVLTGGPGTGKTCVLKCIKFCIEGLLTDDILFCAPTGKAARRITESVGCNAYTVHTALHLVDEDSVPQKISNKVVIVDEISMLDTHTAWALFEGVSINTKLILVGDVEQLPSVGPGSVLRDLIDAGVPCVKLEKTFRQASESGLFANIEQIKLGLHMGFVERDDFKVIRGENSKEAKELMIKEFLDAVSVYGKEQVVCLTPYRRKGEACAIVLNRELQNRLNPAAPGKPWVKYTTVEEDDYSYEIVLRIGDPVMQLQNTSTVANGDVGVVKSINPDKKTVTVKFIDCDVTYEPDELNQITLAYAMSVHKSQGSEYACVITSAIESDYDMLSRNTIYTAVTRAKKECRIITHGDVAQRACSKEVGYERITRLTQKIKHEQEKYNMLSVLIA